MRLLFWRKRDRDLQDEIRSHLEMAVRERIERGELPEDALHAARREFGNEVLVKETTRAMWGWRWLENLFADVRYGLRMLRKTPGFTVVAVGALALGIGANTAIFSLIDAVMLKPLPARDPQQLVLLTWRAHHAPEFHNYSSFGDCHMRVGDKENPSGCSFSYPFFQQMQAQMKVFSGVTAFCGAGRLNLSGNGPASIVRGELVSGSFFETLGVGAAFGRTIQPADDTASAAPVVVLSYGYWQRNFGGDPSVIGRTVRLNNVEFTIAGVTPAQFPGVTPGNAYDLYVPLSQASSLRLNWETVTEDPVFSWWLVIVGRLRPGASLAQAQAAANVVFQNDMLHASKPLSKAADDPSILLLPAGQGLNGERAEASILLYVLMLTVGVVLLIACANVAGLMLARSSSRRREMAVRLALGAGRRRIARQLITESVLLSVVGGAFGCYVAYGGVRFITSVVSSAMSQPFPFVVSVDWRVLLFTAAVSILTGILFGLVPALRSTRVDLTPALKNGPGISGAPTGRRWLTLGNSLVVAQVALAVVVLAAAGLFVRTLRNLETVNPGFDTNNVLLFAVNPQLLDYKPAQIQNTYRDLLSRLGALPGVISAGYSSSALLSQSLWTTSVRLDPTTKSNLDVDMLAVGPGFFHTLRIPMLMGRGLDPADYETASLADAARRESASRASATATRANTAPPPPVPVLVNEAFAHRHLDGRNPVGILLCGGYSADRYQEEPASERQAPRWQIVGVVGNTKYPDLRREIHPTMYSPLVNAGAHFELRTAADPAALIPVVRQTVADVDSNLPLFEVKTQSTQIQQILFEELLVSRVSSSFGLLALALACLGLYGLLSYEVGRRTREIGIRMALGAERGDVHRLVVGRGMALAIVGAVLGLAGAFGVTRFLETLLYGVRPMDPLTFVAVGMLLLLTAFAGCYVPARRATRVDPMTVLRFE
ncbi:MAG: ABC transporter permease [Acidobacteriota bacterium]|nr:ABC transporter permease [Acidobacteriota bacterium]